MVQDKIDDRRLLPAGELDRIASDSGANDRKDARSNNGADAKRSERDGAKSLLQRRLRALALDNQLVDGLGGEELSGMEAGRQGAESSSGKLFRNEAIVCGIPPRQQKAGEAEASPV
jgi:hypothetical protein